MAWSSASLPRLPTSIRTMHSTVLLMMAVRAAVFTSAYFLAPKNWDTITELPMLQPKAKAMKIRVIS